MIMYQMRMLKDTVKSIVVRKYKGKNLIMKRSSFKKGRAEGLADLKNENILFSPEKVLLFICSLTL